MLNLLSKVSELCTVDHTSGAWHFLLFAPPRRTVAGQSAERGDQDPKCNPVLVLQTLQD
jgi:hypothetical protein